MTIPPYLNCNSMEVSHCDFYLHKDCPETCGFAKDIKPQGVGAVCDEGLIKRLEASNDD